MRIKRKIHRLARGRVPTLPKGRAFPLSKGRSPATRKKFSTSYILYLIGSVCIIIGILLGALVANQVNEIQKKELIQHLEIFFNQFPTAFISSKTVLFDILLKNIKHLLLIWGMGFLTIGIPFVWGILVFKGWSYGFTSAFLFLQYGWSGIFFGFIAFIPQNFIFIPTFVFVSKYSVQWSIGHYQQKQMRARWQREQNQKWIEYGLVLMIGTICILLGSIVETYFTPVIMRFLLSS